jgi:curved DNA-binding protein CbpA
MSSDDELFEKMMNKTNSKNLNNISDDELFNKMKSKNKSPKSDDDDEVKKLKKSGLDYYRILNVEKTASVDEIKKKYRHLLAKYHPDKLKSLSEEQRKNKLDQYQLIRMAGEVLTHHEKKKLYDMEQKTIRSSGFVNQKDSFEEFLKLQDLENTPQNREKALLDFKQQSDKMNKLRNYDPMSINKIDKKELNKNVQDLLTQRDVETIELSHQNMFEGRTFNPSEFNKMFEKNKKKEEKKLKKKQAAGELVKYDENFTAFNDNGLNNFIGVNDDYGELFGNEQFRDNSLFSHTTTGTSDVELSSDSDISVDYNDDYTKDYNDDYTNHKNNKLSKNDFDKLLAKRNEEDNLYKKENINREEFFKDVMQDQFGISKDFGVVIGDDMGTTKPLQITSHMAKVYNKMISYDDD